MKHSVSKWIAIAMVTAVACCAPPAFSARVMSNVLVGTVTGVSGNQIVVDGKSYSVKVDGPTLRELQSIQVGEVVDLMLDGPPQAAGSQVIGIHAHEAQQ